MEQEQGSPQKKEQDDRVSRPTSVAWRDLLVVAGPVSVGLVVLILVGVSFLRPAPPDTIRMISGPEDSTYRRHAEKYKKIIEKHGVKVELVPSKGSVDSLRMMAQDKPAADLAMVQGGLTDGVDITHLVSLGSVFVQPLMVYTRGPETVEILAQLRGKRLAVGPQGSGTRALTLKLLKANEIDEENTELKDLGGDDAADALIEGKVDAAFLAGDSASGKIQRRLRETPGIALMSFRQAEAYRRKFRFLSHLTLPEGGNDFDTNHPPHDCQLLGPMVELVASEDLHPALSDLIIKAAREVHGRPGMYREAGQFPAPDERDFTLSEDAVRFYKSGGKFFYKHLPFWLASLADRLFVLVVPLLVLLVPASKMVPKLYNWRLRSRIYRNYGALMAMEREMRDAPSAERRAEIVRRLDDVQREVTEMKMPASFADQTYALRDHVASVRRQLTATPDAPVKSDGPLPG